jgi:hypothetical protein
MEETSPDGSGTLTEDPGGCEIDDVEAVVGTEEHVPVVEIGQRHSPVVELLHHRGETIENEVFEPVPNSLTQWLGVHPPRCQAVRAEEAEEEWKRIDSARRDIGGSLAPDQPTTESVADQSPAWLVGLHRHPLISEIVEEDVCLGPVAADDATGGLDTGETPGIKVFAPGVWNNVGHGESVIHAIRERSHPQPADENGAR